MVDFRSLSPSSQKLIEHSALSAASSTSVGLFRGTALTASKSAHHSLCTSQKCSSIAVKLFRLVASHLIRRVSGTWHEIHWDARCELRQQDVRLLQRTGEARRRLRGWPQVEWKGVSDLRGHAQ